MTGTSILIASIGSPIFTLAVVPIGVFVLTAAAIIIYKRTR